MKLHLASVGRLRAPWSDAADDYTARIQRYARLRTTEVREAKLPDPVAIRRAESTALLAAVAPGSTLIVLDERGASLTSRQLAQRLDAAMTHADSDWTLCIGGANGHDATLRDRAAWTWSLSPLTLPHELARVVVLEQLYRAFTILRGEPYHRD